MANFPWLNYQRVIIIFTKRLLHVWRVHLTNLVVLQIFTYRTFDGYLDISITWYHIWYLDVSADLPRNQYIYIIHYNSIYGYLPTWSSNCFGDLIGVLATGLLLVTEARTCIQQAVAATQRTLHRLVWSQSPSVGWYFFHVLPLDATIE